MTNEAQLREFFTKTIPDQIHLTAIRPDNPDIVTRDFGTNVDDAVQWGIARNAEGMNIHFTVNRVKRGVNKKPKKTDIESVRFIHADIDPPKDGSPWDLKAVRKRLMEHEAPPSTLIGSGNGLQALWRVTGATLVEAEAVNRSLIKKYAGDIGTHNADRLLRVPGLINYPNERKMAAGRKPVLAFIAEKDDGTVYTAAELTDTLGAETELGRNKQKTDTAATIGHYDLTTSDDLNLAADDNLRHLIDDPKGDDRSADTYRVACEMGRRGFTREGTAGVLLNPENAINAHCADQADPERAARRTIDAAFAEDDVVRRRQNIQDAKDGAPLIGPVPILAAGDPMACAAAFMHHVFRQNGTATLVRMQGDWFEFVGTHYSETADENIRNAIWQFLSRCEKRIRGSIVAFQPSKAQVGAVFDALKSHTNIRGHQAPCWLPGNSGPDGANIVAMSNGLLDAQSRQLAPHTPGFFTCHALPYAWEDTVIEPTAWLRFLSEIFGGDREQIDALQEIFGYLLSSDTSFQKIFLILGPKRSGKGTIGRTLGALLGSSSITSPTLTSLTTQFGVQPLIGKTIALISDVRICSRLNVQVVVERLLMISGEDHVTVDRKNKEAWTGRLAVRFLAMSNEMPRFPDASGALASRFNVLETKCSFFGKEDRELGKRLEAELPAIFRWALDGRDRLRNRGHFIQPKGGQEQLATLQRESSPITEFVDECCDLEPSGEASAVNLFKAWDDWCARQGRHANTMAWFSRFLIIAYPQLARSRPRAVDGGQHTVFRGIIIRAHDTDGRSLV